MKIAMISFTGNGRRLERSLAHELEKEGHQVLQAVKCKELESDKDAVKCSAREWTGEQFRTRDVLIFIGAVQIAVRLIASFIGSKTTDPAVLVLDEKGQYCIPILSGHIGGANEMAERIAEMAGALPGKMGNICICQKESSLYRRYAEGKANFGKDSGRKDSCGRD